MIEKASQKKSILKNFIKLENYQQTNSSNNRYFEGDQKFNETFENEGDEFESLYGLENEYSRELREKIERSKRDKGRGLLLSFFEFN